MADKETTTAIATYGEWTPEQMEKESKEMDSGGDFWKVPIGTTVVRFLPPKLGWPSPFVIQHQHFIRMAQFPNPIIFCCPKMHEGKKCLSCSKADALETSGNARDAKAAKNLRPSKRVISNVINDVKNPEGKPVIWTFGTKVYEQLKAIRESEEGGGNFLDPIKGFNISVKRVGSGKDDTVYTLTPSRAITPILNMDWIDIQRDPRKLIRIPSIEQMERLLAGDDPKEVWAEGGDASEKPARGTKRKPKDDSDVIDADSVERTAEDDLFDDETDLD